MKILHKLFGDRKDADAMRPLYDAVVRAGRDPALYGPGSVADTVDGRFEAIAAMLSLALIRLEGDPTRTKQTVWLTELFIDDMDGQLREFGVGDVVVGKRIGKMVGALGGRIGAYRDGLVASGDGDTGPLDEAIRRNLLRGEAAPEQSVAVLREALLGTFAALAASDDDALVAGRWPVAA